ncbi:group II intron reverse transcriptase/maturase [Nitrobacter sp. TKz-YC01]
MLNAIYEEDFLGFSYGFRPKRSQHDALDALIVGITSKKVNYILDADIRSYFDSVSQDWLIRFLKHRINDLRMIRLIQKWLKAGILEDGIITVSETGTGQGSVASPLLSNIYLHYVFDLWAERWRRRQATGDMIIVRYADDIIIGFQHESDARRFWDAMRERLREFSLLLHPDKTRLIRFGRFAATQRAERGLGKPETFTFLGFTLICGKTRQGRFALQRKSRGDRMRAKLKEIKKELRRRMHHPIPQQGNWLKQVVTGYFAYHAVPTNSRALHASGITLRTYGDARSNDVARRTGQGGTASRSWRTTTFPIPAFFILGLTHASPSNTQGGSRVPELGSLGSVRGALSNERPYRDLDARFVSVYS